MATPRTVFERLFQAGTERDVDAVLNEHFDVFASGNWRPYGDNEEAYGVIENQQSSPIAALVEKITNSIDAILMRKCYEAGIDPRSADTPQSIQEAIERFFPAHGWDLRPNRRRQAESIQIIADGPKGNTSLVIFDEGEGQHPRDFSRTFLSLLRGNKKDIHFVQGKYNMGGSGAIVFCGKRRYQLIASRRFDKSGPMGFTLVRRHPLSEEEEQTRRSTWYEYLTWDGEIPSFEIDALDLGLYNRRFEAGTVIKLYSYQMKGITDISKDLNYSLNEFLFEPALPAFTIEKPERYPATFQLQREFFGLSSRLEQDDDKYIEEVFSVEHDDRAIGHVKILCYVFKPRLKGKDAKESGKSIRREFFKNGMAVVFTLNGQVHGHYTSEFISRTLKFPLLHNHLLIHVDCTGMAYNFRKDLFMASRDRLKGGDEANLLRASLAEWLRDGRLKEINKRRKDSISLEGSSANELLRSITRDLPINSEILKLLGQTFRLDEKNQTKEPPGRQPQEKEGKERTKESETTPFQPKRFPSFLKLDVAEKDGRRIVKLPLGGKRTVKFLTDVENQYFDRNEEPGEFRIELLGVERNDAEGGTAPGLPDKMEEVLRVTRSSPDDGIIRLALNPTEDVSVGDAVEVRATLTGAGEEFDQIFWVRIVQEEPKEGKKPEPEPLDNPGLPSLILVYEKPREDSKTWDDLGGSGIEMNHDTILYPSSEGDILDAVYINMDSRVLKTYKSRLRTEDQFEVAQRKYIASVFFHCLFLYSILRHREYSFSRAEESVDLSTYLQDMFQNHYASFLLNFGMADLMQSLDV